MTPIPFQRGALVVTSISGPNPVLKSLAAGARDKGGGAPFIVMGDSKSPADFALEGCDFYNLARQRSLPYSYAAVCPERSYTRKNIGYLAAIAAGAQFITETDDDNIPREDFWAPRACEVEGDLVSVDGWLNAYAYFSDSGIYPRGFPLELVRDPATTRALRVPAGPAACPIQQGLADGDPDVDAVYRMLFPLPLTFRRDRPLILDRDTWCPFNSQNTTTFPQAYPLLYLPARCSFRMTDIWRSFVAQRIAWTCGWRIAFHAATVFQQRNEHDPLRDFADEVPGYLNNQRIARTLAALDLPAGPTQVAANLVRCYEALIGLGVVAEEELPLLEAWLKDLDTLGVLAR